MTIKKQKKTCLSNIQDVSVEVIALVIDRLIHNFKIREVKLNVVGKNAISCQDMNPEPLRS